MRLHPCQQIIDVRRAKKIGIHQIFAEQNHVAMAVDKARQQGLSAQINNFGGFAFGQQHFILSAQREDLSVFYRECLDISRFIASHCQNVATQINGISDTAGDRSAAHENPN